MKAATLETLQGARVAGVDLGDDVFGAHVEEGELQAFANGASAKPLPPSVMVSDSQDDFAVSACLDQTDKADGGIASIVSHEETAALIEQMRQDRHLGSIDGLCDEPGHAA